MAIRIFIIVLYVAVLVAGTVNIDDDDVVRVLRPGEVSAVAASAAVVHNDSHGGTSSFMAFKEDVLLKAQRPEMQRLRITRKQEKDRFNFASRDSGAKISQYSSRTKSSSAILSEDRDSYMNTPCDEKKWVVLSLCEEILAETIAIANFEFHSSTFKDFHVLGSQTFPTEQWALLGTFQAKNLREIQEFELSRPAWVRFIKLIFVTHYGSEYNCPVSLVRVHGITAMQAMKEELEMSRLQMQDVDTALQQQDLQQYDASNSSPASTPELAADGQAAAAADHAAVQLNITVDVMDDVSRSADLVTGPGNNSYAAVVIIAAHTSLNVSSNNGAANNSVNVATAAGSAGNVTNGQAVANQTATTAYNRTESDKPTHQETPESIFKTLTSKVKSLEVNMTLSNAFLERLNKRLSQEVANLTAQVTAENALTSDAVVNITRLFDVLTAVQLQLMAMQVQVEENRASLWLEEWWWRAMLLLYGVALWYVYKQAQQHAAPTQPRPKLSRKESSSRFLAAASLTVDTSAAVNSGPHVTTVSPTAAVSAPVSATGPTGRRKKRVGSTQFTSVPESAARSMSAL